MDETGEGREEVISSTVGGVLAPPPDPDDGGLTSMATSSISNLNTSGGCVDSMI